MNTKIKLSKLLSVDISQSPHCLIVGQTGSGKSMFANYLILQYAKMINDGKEGELFIADGKHADLWLVSKINNFPEENIATSPSQICKILRLADKKMQERYEKYFVSIDDVGKNFTDFGLAPIFIIIDEFSAFVKRADKNTLVDAKKYLFDIIMRGRQVGVLIGALIMQRPDAELLDGAIRDQMSMKVSFSNLSSDGYRMIFGKTDVSYKSINEKGAGYIMIDGQMTSPIYYEAPWMPPEFNFLRELEKYYL
ncbi:FtsK/SpoIIIE domain-containing protein [Streptococcus uberis]|uniref:FtsK/SpoIIIE domain-containing protein n=1 Tax=Streptococcus uberis TaxID=1349 RepID=UPI001FF43DB9|nr:FtsK/SpoIIIE domain-containing protein [Streptococcus uberis]MCK1157643.1 DUF87 domain-containing protein [Streptococcus uberis]MCK1250928.1 DUF87 domain-containing protein [Streptococcus uberis]